MKERIALVSGGTRGIGAEISRALQKNAYKVIAIYHGNDQKAHAFADETGINVLKWDVADAQACEEGIQHIHNDIGHISVLVNNAGITRDTRLAKMTFEQWDSVIRTNLYSCFNMTKPVLGNMKEQGFGRIINLSSINGIKGQFGQVNYATAKAGMLGFTRALALETARDGITVNAIAPGYIDTEMVQAVPEKVLASIIGQIPVNRLGKPQEIGALVAYLASDAAGFITGATVSINGGQLMC